MNIQKNSTLLIITICYFLNYENKQPQTKGVVVSGRLELPTPTLSV